MAQNWAPLLILLYVIFVTFGHQATSTPTPASSPFFPSSSASRQTAPAFVTTCQPGLKRSSSLHHKCGLKTSHEQLATAGQRRALPVLRAALEASSSSSMAQQDARQLSAPQAEQQTPKFSVRRARPEEVELAASLSMEAFFGLKNLDPFDASQVLRLYRNADGEAFNAVQYLWQRGDLVRRLKQSTKRQAEVEGTDKGGGGGGKEEGKEEGKESKKPETRIEAVFFAEDVTSHQVVGMVELIALPYPAHPKPSKPYLFNLCVNPAWRNQGIGRMLVRRCEEEAARYGHDLLWLHTESDTTREIYTRLGYAPTYQQPSWIQLNLLNVVVAEFNEEKRREKGWVIMAREVGDQTREVANEV